MAAARSDVEPFNVAAMQDQNPRRFAFGPFTLDPSSVELHRGDKKISLRPKCFDLLVYFLEHPGRLITKDELLQNIWNDVIVSEGTINRTVTALRSALDDDADNPTYIETVSRRGYKFVSKVEGSAAPLVESLDKTADFALIHNKREYPLRHGEHLIGRGQDVAIPLYGSAISRHHARVTVSGSTVTLEDLGSRNGTYVNGKRAVGSVALQSGDEIGIGDDRLVLWARSSATASASVDKQR
jgi:DNA-binding winged helix-turn-helix (wHTH) protein